MRSAGGAGGGRPFWARFPTTRTLTGSPFPGEAPSEPGEARRHVAGLTEVAGLEYSRASLWRYEPGAKGRRHKEPVQEETFVVVCGTLTMYLGDPPERHQVEPGGVIHVDASTPRQSVNETDEELLVFVYGAPPDLERGEILDSAV